MRGHEPGYISQTISLFLRDCELFINNPKKIISTFVFPILIGLLIVLVSKDSMFDNYDGTKSGLFTIVCAGIYVGMFNSLTIVVKERKIVKREYMTNMRIFSYIMALVLFQLIICFIQTLLYMAVYWNMMEFPTEGLVFSNTFGEYTITLFLIMFVSDLLGLVISTAVKSSELANLIAPIIIIIQLVLCGVLFKLEDNMEFISNFTVSKWGMEALGSIGKLNDLPLRIQEQFPQIPHEVEDMYEATKDHLFKDWGMLILFAIVLIILSIILLRRVEYDQR